MSQEPNTTEATNEVRELAQELLDRASALEPMIRLDDGTIKSSTEVTFAETYDLDAPSDKLMAFIVAKIRYLAAQAGVLYLSDRPIHIDKLTPSDLPELRARVEASNLEFDTFVNLDMCMFRLQDDFEMMGVEVDEGELFRHFQL